MNYAIFQTKIILENKRVLLLPFENWRNQKLKGIIFDDAIWNFMGMAIKNDQDFENYLASISKDKKEGICYPFLIIDKESDPVAGSTRY